MITYSVLNDITSQTINPEKLGREIVSATCVNDFAGITVIGDIVDILCGDVLDQIVLDTIVHNHTAVALSENQAQRVLDIDTRTREIIANGFAFDGQRFSLSAQAQMNWLGLAALSSHFTWPIGITTEANTTYTLTDINMFAFIGTGTVVVATAVGTGRALKIAVNAATTQAELDAVIDSR